MTLSIKKADSLINLPKLSKAEEILCWNIQKGNLNVVRECLNRGLSPNHLLEQEVIINKTIFSKGSSLLFLVVYSSIFNNTCSWDFCNLLKLLLDMNADIEKSPGGGYRSILEFACANANLIGEDILILLLNSISQEKVCLFLEKVNDPIKKENLRKSFLKKHSSSQHSEESVCNMLLEEHICNIIVSGNEEQLKSLLDLGLDPDYIINQDLFVKGINCFSGSSLKVCVEFSASEKLFGVLALLLERGVSLTLECGGISPLKYVCENYETLHSDIVLCLLTSETRSQVNIALESILDKEKRKKLENQLNSTEKKFQFDSNDSENRKEVISFFGSSFNIDCSLENNQSFIFNENDDIQQKDPLEGSSFQYTKTNKLSISSMQMKRLPLVNLLEDIEESGRELLFFQQYSVEFKNIIVPIVKNKDFSILESTLCNPKKLEKLNLDIQELSPENTFFSCLFKEIQSANIKHVICFLFIKHGCSPRNIVYREKNMLSFVCNCRGSFLRGNLGRKSLMQTIYFLCFLVKEDELIKEAILNLRSNRDKELLKSYFLKKNAFNILEMLKSHRFNYELFKAYLECSILTEKDIITGEPWNVDRLHQGKTFLSQIAISLCKSSSDIESLRVQNKQLCLLDLFSLLLKLGANPDKHIPSKNLSVRKIVENFCQDPIIKEILLEKLKNVSSY